VKSIIGQEQQNEVDIPPRRGVMALESVAWIDREFAFELPVGVFPAVLERLKGTPARASELVAGAAEELLGTRLDGKWSVKEHLGHLADLHSLEERRLREFLAGAAMLSAADPLNRVTAIAGHDHKPMGALLGSLRMYRTELVRKLETLTGEDVRRSALHPRLAKQMRIVDWVHFIAEHDDHHLAQARRMLSETRLRLKLREGM
jgi:hypothetical protein